MLDKLCLRDIHTAKFRIYFLKKGCNLLSTNYINQLEKLEYITTCQHTNYISLKELINYGYIGNNSKEKIYVSPTNSNTEWCNEYLFDCNNIDKERLLKIIYE